MAFLDENKIKDLSSLKDLKKLKSLSLEHNGISDINGLVHLSVTGKFVFGK